MTHDVRVHFEGKDYIWTGTEWYEARSYMTPPQVIVRQLNDRLEDVLARSDQAMSNPAELIASASAARDALQYDRAERLVRRALKVSPGNGAALAVLCSILRARGRPQQALDETQAFARQPHPALLTSRAAALCDLGQWEQAKKEVGRALAIERSEEAFSVVQRIKAERPDLYW